MSALLHLLNVALQVSVIITITTLSCAKAVHEVRQSYSNFERHMYYGKGELTPHYGFRGTGIIGDENRFNSIPENDKFHICMIPLVHPAVLIPLLFIWSLCCAGDFKSCLSLAQSVIDLETSNRTAAVTREENGDRIIKELSEGMKAIIFVLIILPRMIIDALMLWIGCRWLLATNSFADLVMNSVGLEFILQLRVILYNTIASERNKQDNVRTKIDVAHVASRQAKIPNPLAFLSTFLWAFAAFTWTIGYVYKFQGVLPNYKWDVRNACEHWLQKKFMSD
jgi:hypothetical protein